MKRIRRIPTIIGLTILLAGIIGGVILIRQGPKLFLKASPEITPKQVKITNISENSFAVSWITDAQTSGFVKYGTDSNLTMTTSDDRDQLSGKTGNFFTHHITLHNLKPATNYYFKIGSQGKLFDNNGQPYQTTTAHPVQTSPPANDVAYGTIVDQSGTPVEGAIVYLSLANTTPLSTISKSSGSWVIPLSLARSLDLASYVSYDREASIEEIFVQAGPPGTATAVTVTKYDSPVPAISLGRSFDFRTGPKEPEPIVSPPPATPSASKFTLPEIASPTPTPLTVSAELTITNPSQGEEVNSQRPEILGTAPSGETVSITIQSPATYSGKVVVDSQGNWQWTPPADLEPGEHTITASFIDKNGKEQKISRTFTVLAAGGSQLPALTASPSAIATPSPSPTASPTATPAGRVSMPSTEEGVPTPGYLTPTFFVFIMGLVLMFLGIVFNILLGKRII